MPSRRFLLRAAALSSAFVLAMSAGCSEESAPSGADEAASSAPAPAAAPPDGDAPTPITLEITADKTHAVQPGDEIRLGVNVEGFVLDAANIGAGAQPGTGHYHVYLGDADGEALLVSADANAVVTVPAEVSDGTHTLRVQLRNRDHTPLEPPVEATLRLIIYRL